MNEWGKEQKKKKANFWVENLFLFSAVAVVDDINQSQLANFLAHLPRPRNRQMQRLTASVTSLTQHQLRPFGRGKARIGLIIDDEPFALAFLLSLVSSFFAFIFAFLIQTPPPRFFYIKKTKMLNLTDCALFVCFVVMCAAVEPPRDLQGGAPFFSFPPPHHDALILLVATLNALSGANPSRSSIPIFPPFLRFFFFRFFHVVASILPIAWLQKPDLRT